MRALVLFLVLYLGAGFLTHGAGLLAQTSGSSLWNSGGLQGRPFAASLGIGIQVAGGVNPRVSRNGALQRPFLPTIPSPTPSQSMEELIPSPGRAFLLSAAIPGMGQRLLGQDRWIGYVAGEIWAWIQYTERRREGRKLQERYRDLAWQVARRVSSGYRVDGSFEYYEAMSYFQSSGAYDTNPGEPGIQPEEDPETYNGSVWALARQIFFFDDPEAPVEVGSDQFLRAIHYYSPRAYTPHMAWNWSTNSLQKGEFVDLIRGSDENLRRSTTMVGLILANHLLSAVDAMVSSRLLHVRAEEPLLELSLLPGPFHQDAIVLAFRIPF